jgi:3-deoxy-7-phosphoheptulonate synthase
MPGKSSQTYRFASRNDSQKKTVVRVGDVEIGNGDLAIIGGPCAVESREQLMAIADRVSATGVKLFRGGAFKPRTSPYSFQGLGLEGLELLAEVRQAFGLRIVAEVMSPETVGLVEKYADVLQIGARNMQNYSLLRRVGQARKPVLLKRGMVATLEEFLLAAEYILSEGNADVILCERGIRTFGDHARFTLDLSIVSSIQQMSHLPIIVDPSHAAGFAEKVIPLARAGAAVGADGIMVEVHNQPEYAMCDGPQALTPEMFSQMVHEVRHISYFVRNGRTDFPPPHAAAAPMVSNTSFADHRVVTV